MRFCLMSGSHFEKIPVMDYHIRNFNFAKKYECFHFIFNL